jgi:hypothetical protein
MNFSTRGIGMSAGVRGARVSVSSRGLHSSVGVPGTGISYGGYDGSSSPAPRPRSQASSLAFQLTLKDDGTVAVLDDQGQPHSPRFVKLLREKQGERIERWLTERCEYWNKDIDRILNCHLDTPAPTNWRSPVGARALLLPSASPQLRPLGILERFFKSRRNKIDTENAEVVSKYEKELLLRRLFNALCKFEQAKQHQLFRQAQSGDPDAMCELLDHQLRTISWPRETLLSFEIPHEHQVCVDTDLPEIEDLPSEQASVAARGLRINIKDRSETQRRKEYVIHIHAVAFRIVGEVFASLPTVSDVFISGFSQRPDKSTGRVRDEYFLSAKIARSSWERIDFSNLGSLDLPEVFAEFPLRRKMTKTGILSPIEPFDSANGIRGS